MAVADVKHEEGQQFGTAEVRVVDGVADMEQREPVEWEQEV